MTTVFVKQALALPWSAHYLKNILNTQGMVTHYFIPKGKKAQLNIESAIILRVIIYNILLEVLFVCNLRL